LDAMESMDTTNSYSYQTVLYYIMLNIFMCLTISQAFVIAASIQRVINDALPKVCV